MIRDAIVAALYGTAKTLCYLGDWLAREDDEVWRSRAWDVYDGPLDDVMTEACRLSRDPAIVSIGVLKSALWPHGSSFDGYPPAMEARLADSPLEYVDPCQECDGSCGVCDALEMPTRPWPDPRTDTTPWTLRGNAFHATRDAD